MRAGRLVVVAGGGETVEVPWHLLACARGVRAAMAEAYLGCMPLLRGLCIEATALCVATLRREGYSAVGRNGMVRQQGWGEDYPNHAWAEVEADGRWWLVDVTMTQFFAELTSEPWRGSVVLPIEEAYLRFSIRHRLLGDGRRVVSGGSPLADKVIREWGAHLEEQAEMARSALDAEEEAAREAEDDAR